MMKSFISKKKRRRLIEEAVLALHEEADVLTKRGASKGNMGMVQAAIAITDQIPVKKEELVEITTAIKNLREEIAASK